MVAVDRPAGLAALTERRGAVGTGLQTASQQAASALTSQANSQATGAFLRLILVGGLGLVAIAISIAPVSDAGTIPNR